MPPLSWVETEPFPPVVGSMVEESGGQWRGSCRAAIAWRMHHEVIETDTAALGVVTFPCCDTAVDAGMKAATVQAVTASAGPDDGRHRDPDRTPLRHAGGRCPVLRMYRTFALGMRALV